MEENIKYSSGSFYNLAKITASNSLVVAATSRFI